MLRKSVLPGRDDIPDKHDVPGAGGGRGEMEGGKPMPECLKHDDEDDKQNLWVITLDDAIDTIESCAGFTDRTTPVGEAWVLVKNALKCKQGG
jgi:hypothetical protein